MVMAIMIIIADSPQFPLSTQKSFLQPGKPSLDSLVFPPLLWLEFYEGNQGPGANQNSSIMEIIEEMRKASEPSLNKYCP